MLTLTIPSREWYDEKKEEFVYTDSKVINLEHSLVSISKWEEKWKRPFLDPRPENSNKSLEETIDYIRCMTLDSDVDPNVYTELTNENIQEVNAYISDSHTATWFSDYEEGGKSRQIKIVTSELIYAWMVQYNIPSEYQYWHLNRLLTLIRILNSFNGDQKKMSKNEILRQNAKINAARRKQLNTKG